MKALIPPGWYWFSKMLSECLESKFKSVSTLKSFGLSFSGLFVYYINCMGVSGPSLLVEPTDYDIYCISEMVLCMLRVSHLGITSNSTTCA